VTLGQQLVDDLAARPERSEFLLNLPEDRLATAGDRNGLVVYVDHHFCTGKQSETLANFGR
jgi:hypothetical protein